MKKRIVSLLLALALCLSLLPTAALAEQGEPAEQPVEQEQLEPAEPEESAPVEDAEEEEKEELPEELPEEQEEPEEQQDEPEPALQALENTSAPLAADETHNHPICGKTCGHDSDHGSEDWQPIGSAQDLRNAAANGSYYLTTDIRFSSSTWTPADGMKLCLNGYRITGPNGSAVITVNKSVSFTLTDCKRGDTVDYGKITHETGCTGRGVEVNGTFHMYGGSITGNAAANGGGVYVNGGAFHMYDGSITGNAANDNNGLGGGVYVNGGTFEMSGGTIGGTGGDANTAKNGGGVYVGGSGSKFEMSGSASITGNTASGSNNGGGGVYVNNSGTFEMSGSASITGNTASGSNNSHGGGGVYVNSGTFTMSGGTIGGTGDAANTATYGGGVYVTSNGSFTMSASANGQNIPSITGNNANSNGGGVYVNGGTFEMSGGTIGGTGGDANTAKNGGGVYVTDSGKFEMSGSAAQISGNKADQGGGVYVNPSGAFEMSGSAAQISGNEASYGGGVYAAGKFTMSGGSITENRATGDVNPGGGVLVDTNGFTVSDRVKITGNYKGSTGSAADNVHLYSSNYKIIIGTSGLDRDAKIGVTTADTPTADKPVQIATGATADLSVYKDIFTPDVTDKGYEITKDESDNLYLSTHQHKWTYTVSTTTTTNDTITATCGDCNASGGSVTIKAPTELVYSGSGKAATLGNTVAGLANPDIAYKQGNETLRAAPTNVGTYTASITLGGKTASVTYTITKADPQASDFTFTAPSNLTYDGNTKTASVNSSRSGMGTVTVKYYKGDSLLSAAPTDAGEYTVKINVAEGDNYKSAANLTADGWKFSIAKANYTGVTKAMEISVPKTQFDPQNYNVNRLTLPELPEGAQYSNGVDLSDAFKNGEKYPHAVFPSGCIEGWNAGTERNLTFKTCGCEDGYSATMTFHVIGTENYNDYDVIVTVKFVNQTQETLAVTMTGWTYGGTANKPVFTKPDGTIKTTVTYAVRGSDTYTVTAPENAGDYIVRVVCESNTFIYTGTAEFRIEPKTLTAGDLKHTGATTKVYDGTANAPTGLSVSVKPESLVGDDTLTVSGTLTYNNANVDKANTITFTPTAITEGNYRLAASEVLTITGAKITPLSITVKSVSAEPRTYEKGNKNVDVSAIFKDSNDSEIALAKGTGYDAFGIMETDTATGDAGEKNVAVTVKVKNSNYSMADYTGTAKVKIWKLDAPQLSVDAIDQKWNDTAEKTITPQWKGIPADAGRTTFSITGRTLPEGVTLGDSTFGADSGELTYTLTGTTAAHAGQKIELNVYVSMENYQEAGVVLTINIIARNTQAALTVNGSSTVVYGQTLTFSTTGGSGTGKVTYSVTNDTGEATIDADTGVLTPVKVGTVRVKATKAADNDYNEVTSAEFEVTIAKATPAGEPKYTKITVGGKTLADAGLTATGSTLSPNDGTLVWVNDEGNVLPDTTVVEKNTTYKWRFTPDDANYKALTGSVELYHVSGGYYYYTPAAGGTTDANKSPRTGDAGLLVYGLTALSSYTGTALVLRRKRED